VVGRSQLWWQGLAILKGHSLFHAKFPRVLGIGLGLIGINIIRKTNPSVSCKKTVIFRRDQAALFKRNARILAEALAISLQFARRSIGELQDDSHAKQNHQSHWARHHHFLDFLRYRQSSAFLLTSARPL
jgi:hypothetical protein